LLSSHKENSAIVIRLAFVLGNLTTYYEDVKDQLVIGLNAISPVIDIINYYCSLLLQTRPNSKQTEGKNKKFEEFNKGDTEDALTKSVRLLANMLTTDLCLDILQTLKDPLQKLVKNLLVVLKTNKKEEIVLNMISFFTNLLFYDTQSEPIFDNNSEIRTNLLDEILPFLRESDNEEIQIESIRLIGNLSRHQEIQKRFYEDEEVIKLISSSIDSPVRDVKYFTIGTVINVSLDTNARVLVGKHCLDKIINVMKYANIEDIEVSKLSCKAALNLTKENGSWIDQNMEALENFLVDFGQECDNILDVAEGNDKVTIEELRKIINELINNLPESLYSCGFEECGRKFKKKEDLDEHVKRRHGKK